MTLAPGINGERASHATDYSTLSASLSSEYLEAMHAKTKQLIVSPVKKMYQDLSSKISVKAGRWEERSLYNEIIVRNRSGLIYYSAKRRKFINGKNN